MFVNWGKKLPGRFRKNLIIKKTQFDSLVCDKCSLPVPLDFSNSVEKLCDSWV